MASQLFSDIWGDQLGMGWVWVGSVTWWAGSMEIEPQATPNNRLLFSDIPAINRKLRDFDDHCRTLLLHSAIVVQSTKI